MASRCRSSSKAAGRSTVVRRAFTLVDIRTLVSTSHRDLYKAFVRAFSDYSVPLNLTPDRLLEMHRRRAARLDLSVGAFDGSELVGFTVNGFGSWRGSSAGYDAGTGVVPEARGKGLASSMMERSLQLLHEQGATRYVLEVIQTNVSAFRVYQRAGFGITRDLICWSLDEVSRPGSSGLTVETVKSLDGLALTDIHDWMPSWQNSSDSIARAAEPRTILATTIGDEFAGYAVLFDSGDLAQIAVAAEHRRRGVGTALLSEARRIAGRPLRIINTDAGDAETTRFLESLGATETVRQYEMELAI